MNYLKKHWYLVVVTILTLGLGVMVLLTSGRLSQTQQVAPTVPEAQPQAAAPACELAFNITITTETPTLTPTPTETPTPTPTETPTPTATPTPPQLSGCNNTCTVNTDCQSGLVCISNSCRNPSCTSETNCQCQTVLLTPTPPPATCNLACTINSDCASGLVCVGGMCRNPNCTAQTDCVCVVAAAQPTPKIPVSGSGPSILGASILAGGLLILLLGFAL